MDERRAPMDPGEAQRRFAERLEEAALPPFVSAEHDTELDLLRVTWAHGVTIYMDLTRDDIVEPIDEHGRAVILGLRPCCDECAAAIDVYVPGSPDDPRADPSIPGVEVHRGPPLHPRDRPARSRGASRSAGTRRVAPVAGISCGAQANMRCA